MKISVEKDTRISYDKNLQFLRFSMQVSFRERAEEYVKDCRRNQNRKVPRIPTSRKSVGSWWASRVAIGKLGI